MLLSMRNLELMDISCCIAELEVAKSGHVYGSIFNVSQCLRSPVIYLVHLSLCLGGILVYIPPAGRLQSSTLHRTPSAFYDSGVSPGGYLPETLQCYSSPLSPMCPLLVVLLLKGYPIKGFRGGDSQL
uniref:Uncharacterized protein n=1 Tax=Branchiostoma floridae TaxID=7739 RepID=C3YW99_BRAFL|eukprot:XP_002599416.1 hypothetical protein BRAFLDRAFT_106559 [Branchiostoma floridae]